MERCPEPFELECFFETPYVSRYGNEGEGWWYDCLRFDRSAGEDHIVCEIEPGEGEFRFLWSIQGRIRMDIQLRYVLSLDISISAGEEHLIGRVKENGVEQVFKLAIKPAVTFQLGMGLPTC